MKNNISQVVVKRKRGRPRKNPVIIEQKTEPQFELKIKRKRGRPRKNPIVIEQKIEPQFKLKRKRGRPRKKQIEKSITKINEYISTVNVSSQFGVEEKSKQEVIGVHKFVTEPAKVAVDFSMTVNLGNYQSLKVGVLVSVPCYKEEIDKCFEFTSKYVKERLNKELIEAVPSLDVPFETKEEKKENIVDEKIEVKEEKKKDFIMDEKVGQSG